MGQKRLNRRLMGMIRAGDLEGAREVIRRGGDANWSWTRYSTHTSMFHRVLRYHRRAAEWVALLISAGAVPTVPAHCSGETIPQLAARNGELESLRLLHEAGLDLSARQYSDRSALLEAVKADAVDCVEYLLAQGLDPGAMSADRWNYSSSPLGLAASKGSVPMVQAMIRAGLPVELLQQMAAQARDADPRYCGVESRQRLERLALCLDEATARVIGTRFNRSGR